MKVGASLTRKMLLLMSPGRKRYLEVNHLDDVISLDPSRLVTAASGWVDHDVGIEFSLFINCLQIFSWKTTSNKVQIDPNYIALR